MLFPVSGVETSPFVPLAAAFAVSALTSLGGVSGAFLLLPFQMSVLGYTSPSVSATNQVFNILGTPGGIYRFYREGRLFFPLVLPLALGSLPGVFLGALIRLEWLADVGAFKSFAGLVLACLGLKLAWDVWRRGGPQTLPGKARPVKIEFGLFRAGFRFQGRDYWFHPARIFGLSLGVGVVGGVYGIGGGALLSPFLVSFYALPVYVVAGASLSCTLATSVGAVLVYRLLAPWYPHLAVSPDWRLGLLLGLGGFLGMYCGARAQKFFPARLINALLASIVCGTAFFLTLR